MTPRPKKEEKKEEPVDKPKKKRGRPKKSEAEKAKKEKDSKKEPAKEPVKVEKEKKKEVSLGRKKKDKYYYAVGRRKRAIATVRIYKEGEDKITVNDKELKDFFPYFEYQEIVLAPLKLAGQIKRGNITIKVKGGGPRGQAEAARLSIARALIEADKEYRPQLKKAGFLMRDPRKKERKKPGLKRARRAPQWKKR